MSPPITNVTDSSNERFVMSSYNTSLVNEVFDFVDGHFFIDEMDVKKISSHMNSTLKLDVVVFPIDDNKKPISGVYEGVLVSYLVNKNYTKGRLLFADGTSVLYNKALLAKTS